MLVASPLTIFILDTTMKQKLVLIGNGMAGMRTVEELLKLEPEMYDITVFGDEPYGNYNRILLSLVLSGEKNNDEILINDLDWYKNNNITLHIGKQVTKIDRVNTEVACEDGTSAKYDRLIIATGSKPFIIPIPGSDLPEVIGFRDIADVDTMLASSKKDKKAVVIGGGLLGLEAANGLMKQGMDVTVVHLLDTLMERQLDEASSAMLRKSLMERGMKFRMGASTSSIEGNGKVEKIVFADGESLETDLVVMAVGIRPSIQLAKDAGIHCERGIVVNDSLQTFDPKIYALGECVQHRGEVYGLVAPLFDMAKVCANHLAGLGYSMYKGSMVSTKLKVTGIDLFSAGDFQSGDDKEEITFADESAGIYKKIVIKNNVIVGAVMYGDTLDGSWYFQLMREATDVTDLRSTLLFGQAHIGDSGHGNEHILSMPDDTEVCGCNGITKGEIVNAIVTDKLFTLEDVRTCTKASASCGSCTGLVEQILASTLGGDYSAAPSVKPMCGCTDYSHSQVKQAILDLELQTIPEIMDKLDWHQEDGCASCRPALNYYLLTAWPETYRDDAQSRFINERVHANIQKDGTYSVIPRFFGGQTTPNELRAIADVVDKFELPEVKVTGGQRLDILGVTKEQLPLVWKDLNNAGLVSGHAYGKAMRTVKTCVGSKWCRFGTQDSTALGIKLEELTWGSWMPHKFKLAASGCPRNCAEATIKDIGIVCVDSGYEIHIGGNGGIKVRVTDLLTKVKTEEEVLEFTAAFCQFYREDAWYLERTAPWLERVGFSHIKEVLMDEEKRQYYAARFLVSQKPVQIDPWKERSTNNVAAHEFTTLTAQ